MSENMEGKVILVTDNASGVEHVIDKIVGDDLDGNAKVLYQIRWSGYAPREDPRQYSNSLQKSLIQKFHRRQRIAVTERGIAQAIIGRYKKKNHIIFEAENTGCTGPFTTAVSYNSKPTTTPRPSPGNYDIASSVPLASSTLEG